MTRSSLAASASACFYLGCAATALAAQPAAADAVGHPSRQETAAAGEPAQRCLSDLRAFKGQMDKGGYWLGGSDDGYGSPMLGFGYGFGYGYPTRGYPAAPAATTAASSPTAGSAARGTAVPATDDYWTARPGYEIRTLIASADILAQHGQQQACEDVLARTRELYKRFAADMRGGGIPAVDVPDWRQQQIAAAKPVASDNASFRSDELVGTDVRSPSNQALGSVQDLVMSPHTDKIAYLVIGRGGIFGIGEAYVPVPWTDFKAPSSMSVLVLDTTEKAMAAAPHVNPNQPTGRGFGQLSQEVDAYWKAHLSKDATGNSTD